MIVDRILRQRYKILKKIGSGSFGNTYLAIDLDFPEQPQRVVKHFSPKNCEYEVVKIATRLFKKEAQCLSNLGEHEQIPRLYAYFEENGQFYLVQEFIEGQDLKAEFRSGNKWNEAETVKFMQELLIILNFVHKNQTIHRDIKPANIMRRKDDGKLFLIDFGAVKEKLTIDEIGKPSIVIGTPFYMAPEQAMGKPEKSSDVYAVGMLGIQALTGLASQELPRDEDKLKTILGELSINNQLKHILGNMVAFECKNRYADAAQALEAFEITVCETIKPIKTRSKFATKLFLTSLGTLPLITTATYTLFLPKRPNYDRLETYLQNQEWKKADRETQILLLKFAGEKTTLDRESIAKFSCDSLKTINQLWVQNSAGKFGFTPQKKVYIETGNQIGHYTESTYEKFGKEIGWRTFGGHWSLSGEIRFRNNIPVGHLPSPGQVAPDNPNLRWRERQLLLSRFDECGL